MPNPTSSRAKHAAGLTGQPPQPRGSGGRSQHAATLTGELPQQPLHPRAQAAAGGRHPAQDQGVVQGSVLLTSVNQAHAVLQDAGNGHGPANRVKAARSLTGVPYRQQNGAALRAGTTPEAMKYMDCSEFVSRVLAIDGITQGILPMNTGAIKALLSQKDKFAHSPDTPRVGDIALWEGHVGIVTGVSADNTFKMTHASGGTRLSAENKFFTTPEKYRSGKFYGYYHPIEEVAVSNTSYILPNTRTGGFTNKPRKNTNPTTRNTGVTEHSGQRSGDDGTFALPEVMVKPSIEQVAYLK